MNKWFSYVHEGFTITPLSTLQTNTWVRSPSYSWVLMYTYTSIRGFLVYTLITLLRKEVFCLKVEARTEQRKGTGE